eukprot:CAMPEP_0117506088 /NCGR_PEP_ID=MMETSP0784-20121206/25721_1 /TAXON_ID=39447 /ORGANISM="" /LENGTH=282 /DNA_ID=CAMNT_0005301537 /DNA_START=130 /DNA_END=979 /DNA_ORIENTATION=+
MHSDVRGACADLDVHQGSAQAPAPAKGQQRPEVSLPPLRVGPWAALILICLFGIGVETYNLGALNLDMNHLDRDCMSTGLNMGYTLFIVLLLNDLLWLGGVFNVLHKKPFLVLHHLIYLAWAVLTILGKIEYVRLIFVLAALEESQEVVASVSYLRKTKKGGPWWLFFTVAWRLMCSAFALGIVMLYLLVTEVSMVLRCFMVFELGLWVFFLAQEWAYLAELVLKEEEEDAIASEATPMASPMRKDSDDEDAFDSGDDDDGYSSGQIDPFRHVSLKRLVSKT